MDIDLKEIKKVLRKNKESSYSFALFVYDASPYHIYNLVMQNDGKGKLKEAYEVGFEMSPEDMESFFMNAEDYGGFRSTFRFYSVASFFEDSKFNRVGKTGDCGTGTTGGNYSGDIGYNSPGTVLSHNYNGNNITTSFSYNTVSTTYNYNSTIVSNGTVSTVSTEATSGVVEVATNGPTAPVYTTYVPNGTTQVNVSYEAPNSSGPGATTEPCTSTNTVGPDGTWSGSLCATPSTNQNKSRITAYGDDCVSGSGTFAINTAAKPIHKLYYALNGSFTAGHFNWFTDPDHTERVDIAKEFVWFLIDNGNTNENINFVLTAISALMDGGNVDVDDRIINFITLPCPSEVVDESNQMDNPIGQKIKEAFGDEGSPDLIYLNADIPQNNENGMVLGQATPTTDSQGNIIRVSIELDNDFLNSATDLSIFANEWSKYVAHVQAGVPQNQILTDLAIQQHQIMGDLVLESAEIIQNYGNAKGYNVSDNTAEALAWAGLQSSTAWTLLDEIVKQNYKNIIDDESSGFEILAIGSPCN